MTTRLSSPFVTGPDEGGLLWQENGLFVTKAAGATTGGVLAGWEILCPRGESPPRHIHRNEDEAWFVLEGNLTFELDGVCHEAAAGAFTWAPRGIPHTFRIDSETARMLVFALPAGLEHFFAVVGREAQSRTLPPPNPSPPQIATLVELAAQYGIDVVGPPLTLEQTGNVPR